jgi:hypothetical protein
MEPAIEMRRLSSRTGLLVPFLLSFAEPGYVSSPAMGMLMEE